MLLFPIYIAIVCYACYRWRRTFIGCVCVLAGLLGVGALYWIDRTLHIAWGRDPEQSFLRPMLVVEAMIVLVLGSMLLFIPRERKILPCRTCRYELHGLEDKNPTCPECGLANAAYPMNRRACRRCGAVVMAFNAENAIEVCGCSGRTSTPATTADAPGATPVLAQPLTSR